MCVHGDSTRDILLRRRGRFHRSRCGNRLGYSWFRDGGGLFFRNPAQLQAEGSRFADLSAGEFGDPVAREHGKIRIQIEFLRRFEGEAGSTLCRSVAAVEEGHRGEQESVLVFLEPGDVNHGGEIERLLQLDFLTGVEGVLEVGEVLLVAGEGLLQQDLRLLHRLKQCDESRRAEGVLRQGEGSDDLVGADRVGNQIPVLMVVADKVTEQVLVGTPDLGGCHRAEALKELARLHELPAGSRSDLKTLGRLDLVKTHKQAVVRRLLRVGEDIVAPHPAEEDEADQQENEDSPAEESVGIAATPVTGVSLIAVVAF